LLETLPTVSKEKKLLEQMRDGMRLKHYRVEQGSDWGCIDLTDSGQRVRNPRNPHEDTVKQAGSQQDELYRSTQTGGAGIMA